MMLSPIMYRHLSPLTLVAWTQESLRDSEKAVGRRPGQADVPLCYQVGRFEPDHWHFPVCQQRWGQNDIIRIQGK